MLTVKITPNDAGNPPGKLADVELHFAHSGDGESASARSFAPLDGLRLIGFGIWESRTGSRTVTFPARSYPVNGERRTFALLRPTADAAQTAHDRLRDYILAAYDAHQAANRPAVTPTGLGF